MWNVPFLAATGGPAVALVLVLYNHILTSHACAAFVVRAGSTRC
jgi:hypothetical protein